MGAARFASGTYDTVLVGGPLMSEADRLAMRQAASGIPGVQLLDSSDDMMGLFEAADAVVSMGGYNSVGEILSARVPALIVPRVHPRREQLIRANLLSERGAVAMLNPYDLSADAMRAAIRSLLYRRDQMAALPMTGLSGFLEALSDDPAAPPVDRRFGAVTRLPVAAPGGSSVSIPAAIPAMSRSESAAVDWA
ncbi:MAG TPA: glycosyltransferase [Thermomicrobiales bacterium]|nr:glycosyltransferase [Thermomicrobiales bacterium]